LVAWSGQRGGKSQQEIQEVTSVVEEEGLRGVGVVPGLAVDGVGAAAP
jgi:hypothetical protein